MNRNVREADGVFLIGSKSTPHAMLVVNRCERFGKPLLRTRLSYKITRNRMLQQAKLLAHWVIKHDMTTIYITGDVDEHIEGFVEALIVTAAQELRRPGCLPDKIGETERQKLRRLKKKQRREEKAEATRALVSTLRLK